MIGKLLRKLLYFIQNVFFNIFSFFRFSKKYSKLKQLKNKFEGKRCFIIATGPSLNIKDIRLIKNEFTFAMNNVCLLYDKTDWRPDFYGIQDKKVFKKLKHILLDNPERVFVSQHIAKEIKNREIFGQFPLNSYYMQYDYRYTKKLPIKFSKNSHRVVYDAYSITFSLMQIAVYMGFKEIYLLGTDCNQEVGKKNHFIESGHIEDIKKLKTSAVRNIYAHQKINIFCKKNDVKVYNATRGGSLEVYDRVNLEDIIKK